MQSISIRNKSMKKIILYLLPIAAIFLAASCATPKKIWYLQDMKSSSQIEIENKFEAKISKYDELRIIVSCYDEELAKPFNILNSQGYGGYSGGSSNGYRNGYLVDVNGNIQFPILGELHVEGMTRLQLQEMIKEMLIRGKHIEDPFVMVRFNNFKIFFLGADGGKAITVSEERCTFLEALALSGDLQSMTNRSKIAVLREVDGKMTMRYLDPRSSKVFNDPYYMLKQNDMILTQAYAAKYYREEFGYWLGWLTMLTSTASLVLSIMTLTSK